MLWWILLLVLLVAILLLLPVGVYIGYQELAWDVFLNIGPVKIRLYPAKKDKKQKKTDNKTKPSGSQGKKTVAGELRDFIPIVKTLLSFLADFRRTVKVNDLTVKIVLGGGDPCNLSILYGHTCAAISGLLPLVDRLLYVKKQNVNVSCDYLAERSVIVAALDFSLPAVLLSKLVFQYGLRVFGQYRSIKNLRKGGTANESESSSNA